MIEGIKPNWPAPSWVRAFTTTRLNGASTSAYSQFNLAMHVHDNPQHVSQNRLRLNQHFNFNLDPIWLNQTHSTRVIKVTHQTTSPLDADGAWTQSMGLPCVVLTGDCLPLLLCDTEGKTVAALHCGWRGLLEGIIENALTLMRPHIQGDLLAWLGPAIGPRHFEVGEDVREPFLRQDLAAGRAFQPTENPHKWLADIYDLAKLRLKNANVKAIYGGEYCTYEDANRFYSHRREKQTGRMASLIWISPHDVS